MIMVDYHTNQFIKTQTNAIVKNSPTMMTRCGWCIKAKKKEEMAKKRLMSQSNWPAAATKWNMRHDGREKYEVQFYRQYHGCNKIHHVEM